MTSVTFQPIAACPGAALALALETQKPVVVLRFKGAGGRDAHAVALSSYEGAPWAPHRVEYVVTVNGSTVRVVPVAGDDYTHGKGIQAHPLALFDARPAAATIAAIRNAVQEHTPCA